MQTFEQYGGGYKACIGCNVQYKPADLVDGRCDRCRPKPICISCLIVLDVASGISVDGAWACRDTSACAERVWRVAAKAAETEKDQLWRLQVNELHQERYRHHNVDCSYANGQWSCPEPCPASDPDWDPERGWH
jgi:hypothetical protein